MTEQTGLYRSNENRVLFGVCGGIAQRFGVAPLWVRLAFVALALAGGPGILAYLVCMLVIPRAPKNQLEGTSPGGARREPAMLNAKGEDALAGVEARGAFQPNTLARR
jgi:phage shock protein C